ncbi:MAG: hypothetical protein J0M15_11650 [Deltaproteobacteria bacterium]|jgi:hypothetical protein|nr:hypothetical protein [Deltaproteobacteria bacterium]
MSDTLTSQNVLPPVAKSFYTFCKKCDADRYHKVLAHTSDTKAKIECEVCHSKKVYTLPKTTAKKATNPSGKPSSAKSPRRAISEGQRKSSHQNEYQALLESVAQADMLDYNMKTKFLISTKLKHPKFGLGYIKSVQPDKIEVIFPDEVKVLIHNRS